MSVHVLSWVLRHSEATLGRRLVLIALAEFAHDDGTKAFPTIETLVERTRLSRSAVIDGLKWLHDHGHIEETGKTRYGARIWRIVMRGPESGPVQNLTSRGPESGPNPLLNRHTSGREGTGAGARLRISGKAVDLPTWVRTEAALRDFNAAAGKNVGLLTGSGEPSESAKRIYRSLVKWPDLDEAKVRDVIDRTLASRWWGADPPNVGVVFGPKVFEENITRPATPVTGKAAKAVKDDERKQRNARRREAMQRVIDQGSGSDER